MDNIGEVLFLAKCMELGLVASRPFSACKYDFVVDNGNRLLRVQVKMTSSTRDTKSSGDVYVVKVANGSGSKRRYTKEQVDVIAVLCHPIGVWYIIPIENAGEKLSMYLYPHRSLMGDFSTGMHESFFNKWIHIVNPPSDKCNTKTQSEKPSKS
tara:strand:+ start:21 stop:482 length:462 start_codon:yes stop_codon:yes gene_type:complete